MVLMLLCCYLLVSFAFLCLVFFFFFKQKTAYEMRISDWSSDVCSSDLGFNRLVLGAGLTWRQVAMLRGYCKFLLQVGVPFSQSYVEETFSRYPLLARL